MKKVFVAIPTQGTTTDLIHFALRQYQEEYKDSVELVFPKKCIQRKFHDFARNGLVEDFLESDADILWFIDSDVVPPPHALDLVSKYSDFWDLAGCPYPVFMSVPGYKGPQIVFTVYKRDETGMHASKVPTEGTEFVDGLGTGCMFIKRDVFEKLEKPYFEFKYRKDDMMITEGEDLGFCRKVSDLGYKFFIDYSMVCKHYKTIDLLDANNYTIEYANQAVEAYNAYIQPKVEQLSNRYRALVKEKKEAKKESPIIRPNSGLILPD